jgi:hypothetical protein
VERERERKRENERERERKREMANQNYKIPFILCSSDDITIYATNFMLFIECICLWSIYQLTNKLNRIQFMTIINLLNVSGQECHPQGIFLIKGIHSFNSFCQKDFLILLYILFY